MKVTAIILAAGQGKRMNEEVAKQYLLIHEKPVLYYSLKVFEEAPEITDIVLVVSAGDEAYVEESIVVRFGFRKVGVIVAGGSERYISVAHGLQAVDEGFVFIHDGARPMISGDIITRAYAAVKEHRAVVCGMPVKDTVKIADEGGYIRETPDRERVWAVQTPQVFTAEVIKEAYLILMEKLMEKERQPAGQEIAVTDDAMVVETFTEVRVKLVRGSYENIKITTREDLRIAEAFLAEGIYTCLGGVNKSK